MAGYPILSGWVLASILLYALTGTCWLPVVWLQIRMRSLARQADDTGTPLPSLYCVAVRAAGSGSACWHLPRSCWCTG
ncbi:DUF2269 family protein [Janthinobacterium sp. LB3P118]|uniref:DUF2269 family protein n=1 Tax=Janthinobacterium sp. LB3P118 TaxID=3424195 RepID=UPI003F2632F1